MSSIVFPPGDEPRRTSLRAEASVGDLAPFRNRDMSLAYVCSVWSRDRSRTARQLKSSQRRLILVIQKRASEIELDFSLNLVTPDLGSPRIA